MRTSLQFFRDLGVCDGAYEALEDVFNSAGVEEFDYDAGSLLMHQMRDTLAARAAESLEEGHRNVDGWFEWCRNLRYNPEAIMYFGDHIIKNSWKSYDGLTHTSLAEAEAHIDRRRDEHKLGYRENFAINAVRQTPQGEIWVTYREFDDVDWSQYDKFVWSEIMGGMRYETTSPTEALAHYHFMLNFFDEIDANFERRKANIQRLIADESDTYEVWVRAATL